MMERYLSLVFIPAHVGDAEPDPPLEIVFADQPGTSVQKEEEKRQTEWTESAPVPPLVDPRKQD